MFIINVTNFIVVRNRFYLIISLIIIIDDGIISKELGFMHLKITNDKNKVWLCTQGVPMESQFGAVDDGQTQSM